MMPRLSARRPVQATPRPLPARYSPPWGMAASWPVQASLQPPAAIHGAIRPPASPARSWRGLGGFLAVASIAAASTLLGHRAAGRGMPPDAALLRLGEALRAARRRETAAWELADVEEETGPRTEHAQHRFQETRAIVRRIERQPAATLAGLLVKMRAVAWCRSDAPLEPEELGLDPAERQPTDLRLIAAVLRDLASIAEARP